MRISAFILLFILLPAFGGCGGDPAPETSESKKPPIVKKRLNWLHSHAEAVAKSKESGKPIFAFFTGSDWCKYCSLLDFQILNTKVFAEWSAENVVLLELDFPRKSPIAPELKKQNEALMGRYRVTGLPTILLLTADGVPLLRAGYEQVPPEKWISVLDMKLKESLQKYNAESKGK